MALSKGAAEAAEIVRNYDGPKIRVMEVCGTRTHEDFSLGGFGRCFRGNPSS